MMDGIIFNGPIMLRTTAHLATLAWSTLEICSHDGRKLRSSRNDGPVGEPQIARNDHPPTFPLTAASKRGGGVEAAFSWGSRFFYVNDTMMVVRQHTQQAGAAVSS